MKQRLKYNTTLPYPDAGRGTMLFSQPQHFYCFCYKVYFLSNFKDFNTLSPAC